MNILSHKRMAVTFGIVSICLLVICGSLLWNLGWQTIRVAWASEQTEIFDEMRTKAHKSDAAGAAACLEYVVGYYPSGTKQETGSKLDRMVERERALAIREIVAHLRTKTGDDLGESPEIWIQKYVKR